MIETTTKPPSLADTFSEVYRKQVREWLARSYTAPPKQIHREALEFAYASCPGTKAALSAYCGLANKHRAPETPEEILGAELFKIVGRARRELIPGSFNPRRKRPVLAEPVPVAAKPQEKRPRVGDQVARYRQAALAVGKLPSDTCAAILLGVSKATLSRARAAMSAEGFVFTKTSKREWAVNRAPWTKPNVAAPAQLALAAPAELPPGLTVTTREVAAGSLGITPEAMAAMSKPGAEPLAAVAFPANLGDVMAKALEAAIAEAMKTAVANVMAATNQPR